MKRAIQAVVLLMVMVSVVQLSGQVWAQDDSRPYHFGFKKAKMESFLRSRKRAL